MKPELGIPWTEKYRPNTLDEVVGHEEIVKRLKAYVKTRSMPHLLFSGPAGVGKTTCAIAMAKEMFGEYWYQNFQETNASDERGINVVREKLKEFARTRPLGGADFKIIFLDESDALTSDAQHALRRTMERFTETCRFILSCNYSSRIIEPIQSRCAVFRFRPLSPEHVKKYIRRIADGEGLKVDKTGEEAIIYICEGDMRRVANILQAASAISTEIDEDTIYKVTSRAKPIEVRQMVDLALKGDFLRAREKLDSLLIETGLSGEDLIKQIHREIFDLPLEEKKKVDLVDQVGEYEFRIIQGGNDRIQLSALLAQLAALGQNRE